MILLFVVSAVGGITDRLLNVADLALNKDDTYKEEFESIKQKHFDIITELIPTKNEIVLRQLKIN